MKSLLTRIQGIALALLAFSPASPAADSMTTAAPITDARMVHNAALLSDGRVLVVGGSTVFNPALGTNPTLTGQVATAQVFDPQSGSWTTVSAPADARKLAAMSVLPNGKVFLAGGMVANGFGGSWPSGTGVIYDPASGTWGGTGTSIAGGGQHTATTLLDGSLLIAGGDSRSCVIYNASTGVGSATGSLNDSRSAHTATLLPNGKVLVDGGLNDFPVYNTELYDPAAGTWTRVASSNVQRFFHSATLLPSGKVLVVGGLSNYPSSGAILNVAQLYDPVANTWTATGSLNSARYGHSATLLPNGKVAVIGGLGTSSTLSSVEIYDPAAGTWSTSTASLATARKFHTATLLTDGRVVIVGGSSSADAALASVEIFTSSSPAWSATGSLGNARAYHSGCMLADGKVLVSGGALANTYLSSTELYDSTTGSWTATGAMLAGRLEHTMTLLSDGNVLAAGGTISGSGFAFNTTTSSCEIYNRATGTWSATGAMTVNRSRHRAVILADGRVMVIGGVKANGPAPQPVSSCEIYDRAAGTWSAAASIPGGRLWHTATTLKNGKVLVTGGCPQLAFAAYNTCVLYDPPTNTWTTTASMGTARYKHSATLLPDGRVLVAGGTDEPGFSTLPTTNSAEIYDPVAGAWSAVGAMATSRMDHSAMLLSNGSVLVAGGLTGSLPKTALSSSEMFNPATGLWSIGPSMAATRTSFVASMLPNGKVLVAGGSQSDLSTSGTIVSGAELLDPSLGFNSAWRPQITNASINAGRVLSITGTALRGISGASSGGTQDSAADFPLVQLRSLGNEQVMWASPASFSATGFTSTVMGAFAPGHLLMTVFTNGIPSESKVLSIPLGPEISVEQPAGINIVVGGSADFGSVNNGTSSPLTFTIKNTGGGPLTVSGVSVTGSNVSDFAVNTTGMSSSVAAGGSTTFAVTCTPSAAGSRSTTLQILNDDNDEGTFLINLTGTGINNAPTISDITDQNINEDGNTGALAFTIGDFETAASSLTVTRSSSNATLVPLANIVLGGTGASRTVTVTPAANLSGTAIITVTVSDGTVSTSDTFNLTVNAVNDPPTLNSITSPAVIQEDAGQQTVLLSGISAGPNESQTLAITATSNNTALIPNPTVSYTSPNTSGSVLYAPVANVSGTATITVTVDDGQGTSNTTSQTFNVTVNAVNDPPTLDAISNPAAILEDAGQQTINLTGISSGPLESQSLVVTASSNNTSVIPNPAVQYANPNSTGTLTYTPVANASGTATITVTVNDQQASNNTFSRTFTVTVSAVNDTPTISDIADQTVNEDTSAGPLAFTIGDVETAASSLIITGSSNNAILVPNANIVFGGSGANRTVMVTPAANQGGTATITVTVSDGSLSAADTFVLTVNSTNDPPTISTIANQVITYNTLTNTLDFTVGDLESPAASLVVNASSSNQTLLPDSSIFFSGSGTTRGVTLVPAFNQTGAATVTLVVSDGGASTTTSFTLTVNAPEIVVEQPFASGIADGGTRGFGSVAVGGSSSLVFFIRNTNAANLTGLTISKDGADAAQFVITSSPVSPVAGPGGNTAFTVQFAPTSAGAKACAIHIVNNDPDENPFDINLTGNGTVPQTNWRQTYFGSTSNAGNAADLADPDGDGVPNLLEYAFGLHPGQNNAGQMPQPSVVGSSLVYTFTEPPGVTGISYSAEWSASLLGGSWSSIGITHDVNNGLHTFTLPFGTAPGAFIRLRVTTP